MNFDVAIIGGGLSGLLCGISLQAAGRRCVLVSAGESSLIMSSGAFELLGKVDGNIVDSPMEAVSSLNEAHPYRKIGRESLEIMAGRIPELLRDCGLTVKGSSKENSFRITPVGLTRRCWLSLDDMLLIASSGKLAASKVLVVDPEGFLDLDSSYVAEAVEKAGCSCRIISLCTEEFAALRKNPSEMRSVAMARLSEDASFMEKVAEILKNSLDGEDLVLVPAVFGLRNGNVLSSLSESIGVEVKAISTLPPSTPGIRIRTKLKSAFEGLGGTLVEGDTVESADIEGAKVKAIYTEKLCGEAIVASDYVLASGSFFGRGLRSDMEHVYEPVFGADVACAEGRGEWYNSNFFSSQAYEGFGVVSDGAFRLSVNKLTMDNLYGAGLVLAGADVISEQSKEGVEMMTALAVADEILKK